MQPDGKIHGGTALIIRSDIKYYETGMKVLKKILAGY